MLIPSYSLELTLSPPIPQKARLPWICLSAPLQQVCLPCPCRKSVRGIGFLAADGEEESFPVSIPCEIALCRGWPEPGHLGCPSEQHC